jgi:3-oxoacyl-[acyl-carrier-protein] synthase II
VTGIGVVSPIGIGVRDFWKNTLAGKVGTGPLTRFDPSDCDTKIAAQVDDFDASDFIAGKQLRRTDRYSQFAVAAARLALDVAALTNAALAFGLRGPNVANSNSCAAGAVAIGDAYRAVARGDVRVALAGGSEAPLAPLSFGAFATIKAMSTRNDEPERASRPFDRDRDGFVMAEGAAMLCLQRLEDALAADARIYGEISGFGLTADAHHMTAPKPDGRSSAQAMTRALHEARVSPDEVELLGAHGSSSPLNDVTETIAFKRALGAAAYGVPVAATKGQHGHALGATSAWEAALAFLAMHEKRVPGMVNLEHVDPACDLDYVREVRAIAPRIALCNSAGFGGINAALVLRGIEN